MQKLNRATRRKLDKKVKKQLSNEQYDDLKKDSIGATIEMEVDRQVKSIFDVIMANTVQAMKENRISDDRITKILARVVELGKEGAHVNTRD